MLVRQVAFNREIRTPSVTLEGDVFQPSGLLTGGSRKYVILSIRPVDLSWRSYRYASVMPKT